ncbi:MAG: hypothetical protein ACR2KS_11730 [Candidatus Eremiobacter antarcticus]|nr:hypothetical protein [Candidatus Eremiobacteraeota bacterium]
MSAAASSADQPVAGAVPAIVRRAAEVDAAALRGFIGMQRHFSTDVHVGPVRHTEQSESGVLINDGAYVKIKYYKITQDGKAFSQSKLEERESQTNRDWAAGKIFFKEPYDKRFMGDYRFAEEPCNGCAPGTVAVAFTSDVKDAQHGNGTMWIASPSARVEKLTYVPNAFPPHASSGNVTETSGTAMPDLWYVTKIESTYKGHAFIVSGSGTFLGTFDHFKHFSTAAEGEAALAAGSI